MADQPGSAEAAAAAAAGGAAAAAQPVLPWMRVPLNIAAGSGVPLSDVQGLHPALMQAVQQQLGFVELFPVQAAVWRGCQPSSCHVLRGLVVLPTRSLAVQVHSVLHSLGAAAGINVALAAAQEGVAAEAAKLVTLPSQPNSGPHILVATPGRLMAHIQGSTGGPWASSGSSSVLSLQHLKFLVVDEADRLLRQDYHGWLPQVLEHIHTSSSSRTSSSFSSAQSVSLLSLPPSAAGAAPYGAAAAGNAAALQHPQGSSAAIGLYFSSSSTRVLKLVVSATLTRDPSKLMRLELSCPRYIALTDVSRRYTLPAQLEQYRLVVPAQHKPLALVGLLHRLGQSRTVVFASSLDMTHRLYLLLAAVPGLPGAVAEYSSHVAPDAQVAALSAFKQGRVQVLVTSDAMARGMDVSGISCVINYDPPTYPKTYVHRAGRTARAGSTGAVYSLLKPEDVVHFNGMVRKMQGSKVQQVKLLPAELQEHRPALKAALKQVQELVQLEQQQEKQQQQGAVGREQQALNKRKQGAPGSAQQPQPKLQQQIPAEGVQAAAAAAPPLQQTEQPPAGPGQEEQISEAAAVAISKNTKKKRSKEESV